jgi:hypothetical protein
VLFPQGVGHIVDLLAAILLTCIRIDDKDMFHILTPTGEDFLGLYYKIETGKLMNKR